ncbi:TetR/AcrR family transcriptional regulator [Cryptosporangium aurantiacum]|uniref:Transcriptional regulator, TetR family n=1 Tax=Cryptosporangium aurantiacum TaxID=134849 RepID=A0A1M7QCT1_9ACTN|nr:transcriptional regulator, TetR family [Cryptosporangium aurantiacum]
MLDAATAVFSERGFHAASMDEIAERAGISKPMVYLYLGSKGELFSACIRRAGAQLTEAISAAADPELPAEQQLWAAVQAFFHFVGAHRDAWAVMFRQARGEGEFAGEVASIRSLVIGNVADLFARAIRSAGALDPGPDELLALAHALVGTGESMAEWLLDHPAEEPGTAATRLMNVLWMGLGSLIQGEVWRTPAPVPPVP